jgi:hypothetical protein
LQIFSQSRIFHCRFRSWENLFPFFPPLITQCSHFLIYCEQCFKPEAVRFLFTEHFMVYFFFGFERREKQQRLAFYAFCIIIHNHSLSSVALDINIIFFYYEILINLIHSHSCVHRIGAREKKSLQWVLLLMKLDEHRLNLYLFICWMSRGRRERESSCDDVVVVVQGILLWWYIKNVIVLLIHSPTTTTTSSSSHLHCMWALYVLLIHLWIRRRRVKWKREKESKWEVKREPIKLLYYDTFYHTSTTSIPQQS